MSAESVFTPRLQAIISRHPSTVPRTASAPTEPAQLYASIQNPLSHLHQTIFNDLKDLIQPIANSISTINARLDNLESRGTPSATAAIPTLSSISYPAAASSSGTSAPVPTTEIPEYNLASTTASGSH
ncbi:UNVERIFIED_CONTAM: hypothetical protein FKN15_033622 [Acipenser sinensis]